MTSNYDVAVIGNWHLSSVTAGVLGAQGTRVMWVNPEGETLPWLKPPRCPVNEPGLEERFSKARAADTLDFSNDYKSWQAKIVWIAIDTPVNEHDQADLSPLKKALEQIKAHQKNCQVVVVSSQVPLGFCLEAENFLKIPVAYVPENLRLGHGIETFEHADRTVIGSTLPQTAENLRDDLFKKFTTKFLLCNLATAEMVKHATNAFLATSISFANQMALIGEAYGVDNFAVAQSLKMDLRIGPAAYVRPGLGFAGGTLPRDLRILKNLADAKKLRTDLVDAVLDINADTTNVLVALVEKHVKEFPGPVLILGYTYKADTDTLRRSLSIDVASELKKHGHKVLGFDPTMNGKDVSAITPYLDHLENLSSNPSPSVVMLMTPRPVFKEIEFSKLKNQNTLLLDAHGFYASTSITSQGLDYQVLWGKKQSKT